MKRASVFLLVGTAFGIGGMTFADRHDKGESVRTISSQYIEEKLAWREPAPRLNPSGAMAQPA